MAEWIATEEQDRIVAAKDAQIAALERQHSEAQAMLVEMGAPAHMIGRGEGEKATLLDQVCAIRGDLWRAIADDPDIRIADPVVDAVVERIQKQHEKIVALETIQLALEARPRCFAVAFITNEYGELLLIRNKNRGGWELPGGHVEKNEDPREAARREAWEEAGVDVSLDPLPFAVVYGPRGVANVYRGTACGNLNPGDDADDASWFTKEQVAVRRDLSDIPSVRLIREWMASSGAPLTPGDAKIWNDPHEALGCDVDDRARALCDLATGDPATYAAMPEHDRESWRAIELQRSMREKDLERQVESLRQRLDIRTGERDEALRQLGEARAHLDAETTTRPRIGDPIVRRER